MNLQWWCIHLKKIKYNWRKIQKKSKVTSSYTIHLYMPTYGDWNDRRYCAHSLLNMTHEWGHDIVYFHFPQPYLLHTVLLYGYFLVPGLLYCYCCNILCIIYNTVLESAIYQRNGIPLPYFIHRRHSSCVKYRLHRNVFKKFLLTSACVCMYVYLLYTSK